MQPRPRTAKSFRMGTRHGVARLLAATLVGSSLAVVTSIVNPAPASAATPVTTTFAWSGALQTYTVPAGVTRLSVELAGGNGGNGEGAADTDGGDAGVGGVVSGSLSVSPGDVVSIAVGAGGGNAGDCQGGGGGLVPDIAGISMWGGNSSSACSPISGTAGGGGAGTGIATAAGLVAVAGGGGGGGGGGAVVNYDGGDGGDGLANAGSDGSGTDGGEGGSGSAASTPRGGNGKTHDNIDGGGGGGGGGFPLGGEGGEAANGAFLHYGGGGGGGGGGSYFSPLLKNGAFGLSTNTSGQANGHVTITYDPGQTDVAVTASPNPSIFGQAVTVTGTATSPTEGCLGGNMTFSDGSTVLISKPTDASGVASFTTISFELGDHPLTASFTPTDSTCTGSTSPSYTQTVQLSQTTLAVAASPNPALYGSAVTVTATVSGIRFCKNGTVTFSEGTPLAAPQHTDADGAAHITIPPIISRGTHTITASFVPDSPDFCAGSDGSVDLVVQLAQSSVALTASPNPASPGELVTFTATVTAQTPATCRSGSVVFKEGSTLLSGNPTDSNGVVTYKTSTLTLGTHSITAEFLPNATDFCEGSTSTVNEVIAAQNTFLAVTSSANPVTYGNATLITGTVTSTVPACLAGNMAFYVDGALANYQIGLDANGQRSFSFSGSVGTHSIVVGYEYPAGCVGPTVKTFDQVVTPIPTGLTISSSQNPSEVGTNVTITAQVTSNNAACFGGGMAFYVDGVFVFGGNTDATGKAIYTFSGANGVGTHTVTAGYEVVPANCAQPTPATLNQVVTKHPTTTSLTSSLNPSTFGDSVTFTATVGSSADACKAGTVTFKDGTTTLGTSPTNSSGVATFTTSALTTGTHSVTASYAPTDGTNCAGSASTGVLQVVNKASTSTGLASSVNPSTFAQNVTFTATVSSSAAACKAGTVTFKDGTTSLGTASTDAATGVATKTTAFSAGTHSITASFLPSDTANCTGSDSSAVSQVVNKAQTSNALRLDTNPSVFGQSATFTAAVVNSPAACQPGTMTFKEGTTTLGSSATDSLGVATMSTSSLSVGTHVIKATFAPTDTANCLGSDSAVLSQVVNKANTQVAVSSSANPSSFGSTVTFTADVAPVSPGAGTPTGTVQFKDGPTNLGPPVALSGGTAQLTAPALLGGSHSITAVYSGDGNFNPSSGSLTQVVTCTRTYTGTIPGLTVPKSGSTCFADARVNGTLSIPDGASVSMSNSYVAGWLATSGAPAAIVICGSTLAGAVSISNVSGLLLLGNPFDSSCAANQFNSTVSLSSNRRGLTLVGNKIYGNVSVTNNTGGPVVVGANKMYGRLACTGNNPDATNNGRPNDVAASSGECGATSF